MSIAFSGCRSRSGGLISAISKQIKLINLKPVTKISVKFDPFHENVSDTREFMYHLSGPRVIATNYSCSLKSEIICDLSEPSVTYTFESGKKVILKSGNLTTLELLKIFNKHISENLKPSETTETISTKKKGKKLKK